MAKGVEHFLSVLTSHLPLSFSEPLFVQLLMDYFFFPFVIDFWSSLYFLDINLLSDE